jgi:3-methyladenine DNA glycosylase Tag
MQSFQSLFEHAAKRKGGTAALEALLPIPLSSKALTKIPDDRWLAMMSRCIFQAGFSWKVIDKKWPEFEESFAGFNPKRWREMSDDDFDRLLKDRRIVRNATKILTVRDNATFLCDLAEEHGSAAKFFAEWPTEDYVELLILMKKRGSRLGGNSAQYFLRFMGKDSFITSQDVVTALIREGVISSTPKSQRDLRATQQAFNQWQQESGRSLTQISKVLAFTIGA